MSNWDSAGTAIHVSTLEDIALSEYHPRLNGQYHAFVRKNGANADGTDIYQLILPDPWNEDIGKPVSRLKFIELPDELTSDSTMLYAENQVNTVVENRRLVSWTIKKLILHTGYGEPMNCFLDIIQWSGLVEPIADNEPVARNPGPVKSGWVWRGPNKGEAPPTFIAPDWL